MRYSTKELRTLSLFVNQSTTDMNINVGTEKVDAVERKKSVFNDSRNSNYESILIQL